MLAEETSTACLHCLQPVLENEAFCCSGCEMVYGILNQQGLGDYYQYRGQIELLRAPAPVREARESLDWANSLTERELNFYLEGVHCSACVWLVEKLPTLLADVEEAHLNLGTQLLQLKLTADGDLKAALQRLQTWGYRARLIRQPLERETFARQAHFWQLCRLGVAAFGAGNLMILSVALYAGLNGRLIVYFEWLSLLLALPVLIFSAWPFYWQAWLQLRYRQRVSVDLPIAISLWLGTLGSIYSLLTSQHELYLDSLSMLVFLLLLSRYTLQRTQQALVRHDLFHYLYQPQTLARLEGDQFKQSPFEAIQVGDCVRLEVAERIPLDAEVLSGKSWVDQAILTGESQALPVSPGSLVFAGSINQDQPLIVSVRAIGQQTRLAQIIEKARNYQQEKSRLLSITDQVARYFVSAVLLTAAGLGIALWATPALAISRILALVIVACPCALALATPLIIQISLKTALAKGFFVQNAESFEQLQKVKMVVFDKTGTLTEGRFQVLKTEGLDSESKRALWALESESNHPIARTLRHYLLASGPMLLAEVTELQSLVGGGLSACIQGVNWRVQPRGQFSRLSEGPLAQVCLDIFCDGSLRATLYLGDSLKAEAAETVATLQAAGLAIYLLSGDQADACLQVAHALGIPESQVLYCQSPEAKAQFLEQHPLAMMVGDGINDLQALSKARVGVSVQGSAEENLQLADVFLADSLKALPAFFRHARLTRRLLYSALTFSLLYNLVAVSAAIGGYISPLVAAIVMPISALTVFLLALWGGQRLCRF